ncbi:ABC transporter permease [Brevibacterium sp. 50QC2O2]|uniref:ABC transporter permease n=1 Tax=Brevibacterium TaxID=1696 RepID=UPI00211BFC20|nr:MULTISPECIES: ABC transporter permease [unclassified Brevibacterium]MCQ9367860.1 ABC transporter permease [Brevibacterium sp. 91QC2O2]MCQ9386132.1 ABC transporter permease [Brevibacterium sp. 68QC2CO]MCQ9387192.1 ABC transporter permease [Brevibacterium sp. 50QC2O2]
MAPASTPAPSVVSVAPTAQDIDPARIHAAPEKNAFRRAFAKLHPSLQLVLLQFWMPAFMAIMFVLCYVGGFQHLSPHDVPVAVVGDSVSDSRSTAAQFQEITDKAMPGGWDFSVAKSEAAAREDVRTGEVAAAYDAQKNTLIMASAHQAQLTTLMPKYLDTLLFSKAPATIEDIAPLPAGDMGMTPMYLMLTWCITGYLAAMFIGLMGAPLRRMTRFAIIVGGSVFLTGISCILVDPVLGAITGHFWALWGLGACWAIAIGTAVNGLSYFFGRFIAAPAMILFIFLSIPASGAAMPQWFIGQPFNWLNHVVVGSGITEMLKRLVYDVGPGYNRGWIMLACYLVIGVLLTIVGKPYWEARRVRHMLRGRTTMFQDAQRANGRLHEAERKAILGRYNLEPGPEGTVIKQEADDEELYDQPSDAFGFGSALEPDIDESPRAGHPRH